MKVDPRRFLDRRLLRLPAIVVLILALSPAGIVWAHALLIRATPGPGSLVQTSPSLILLGFSEDLNPSASQIIVWDRYRHVENVGHARLVPGQSRQLEVGLKHLAPGSYLVLWTSASADDGHILHGYYTFSVKVRGPGPSLAGVSTGSTGQTFPNGVGLTSLLAHWLELLGAVVWAGMEAFALLVIIPLTPRTLDSEVAAIETRRRRLLSSVSLVVLILSSAVVLLMLVYGLAGNWGSVFSRSIWSEVFSAQYGHLWLGRQALALVALLLVATNRPASGRQQANLQVVLGGVYLYLFAGSGHAAAVDIGGLAGSHFLSISVLIDWLHFIADALWFGSQMAIVLILLPALLRYRRNGSIQPLMDALNRFSPVAYTGVALFILSGFFNAKVHIPSWYAFFNSVYGKTLIIKMILIGLMMLVSVLTVFFVRPRIKRAAKAGAGIEDRLSAMVEGLVFWLRVNPALGAGVLLATSVMFSYPVPYNFAPAGPATFTVSASGTTALLTLKPNRSGPNQIQVTLRDAGHHLINQAHVTVLTTMLDMVMGTGLAPLTQTGPGTFTGTADLGMGGHWRLLILVYRPSGLTRLSVTARVAT
jgi:copper transport protein